jgi:glycosyltransferase involved in cell wall biosynthesis
MSDGLVSIIIPTYNRAHCIRRAVDSALGQTYGELDVIVIDDGSRDETPALVRDTYGTDARVRYVRQENRGVSAARNHGIRLVKGSYCALLDSDDVWKPHKLDLQLACLRAFPDAGMVWSDMSAVSPRGDLVAERYLKRFYSTYRLFSTDDLYDRSRPLAEIAPHLAAEVGSYRAYAGEIYGPMVMGNLVHTSTVLLRRERLAEAGTFDETVRAGEDHEFHLATCRGGRVAYADVPTILYEVGADDALTRAPFNVPMARHFLTTLTRELDREGPRVRARIPEATIAEVRADAHRWLGESLLGEGHRREAREQFLASLLVFPQKPRLLAFYASTFLPPEARDRLADAYRSLKRRLP